MPARDEIPASLTPQDALVAVMVAVSTADSTINAPEMLSIARIVDYLPVFKDYDRDRLADLGPEGFGLRAASSDESIELLDGQTLKLRAESAI